MQNKLTTTSARLRLAIQKSGRLHEDSMNLLYECGIDCPKSTRKLFTSARNFPIDLFFLRDDDIPEYVADKVADIGIVGQNVFYEQNRNLVEVETLGFSKCRLSIALPKGSAYDNPSSLNGLRIASSYPVLLQSFLDKNEVKEDIHTIHGSVEIAPSIGLADAVCDLVSTGSTLISNGLREVETIFQSEATLITSPELAADKQDLLDRLLFRLRAVKKAANTKYILLNAPNDRLENIINILPGMKSPTVLPLAESGWSSVHSVVQEDMFWDIIEDLKKQGAQGILVVPIEKMIL